MLLKTKLLISLASVAVAGGTGAGVYYGVIKNNESDTTTEGTKQATTPATPGA